MHHTRALLSLGACARVTVVVLCVYMCVCVSVTVLVATYLVYVSKVRRHTVSCRLLKICIVWTSLKRFTWEIFHHLPATMFSDSALS